MSAKSSAYSAVTLDLFARLPGGGDTAPGRGAVVAGECVALERGAWVRFEARIDGDRIADCAFRAWGCPHTLAASAWACAAVRGLAIDAAVAIEPRQIARELEVPVEKLGRLLVVAEALDALFAAARAVQSD